MKVARGERKKFKLTARRSPGQANPRLSRTVLLYEGEEAHTCSIGFSEDLVHFVGEKLPRGISAVDPAYLMVIHSPQGRWEVRACYYHDSLFVTLWVTPERPIWLKIMQSK